MIIELVGYLGSTLVLVSMLMTSMVKLRVINTIGSVIFTIYALIIRSYPTAFMNTCLVIINLYHLVNLRKTVNTFNLLELKGGEGFLSYLLDTYKEDIAKFFPDFSASQAFDRAFLILFNTNVAGIFIGKKEEDGTFTSTLDYTTPAYRDSSAGTYLYQVLPGHGIKKVQVVNPSSGHVPYLLNMGFSQDGDRYLKEM